MSFLLDTNICSAHVRKPSGLSHRFLQYSGRLFISTIVLGELHVWAHLRPDPKKLLRGIDQQLLNDVELLDFDAESAHEYGRIRGAFLKKGRSGNEVDLLIAAVALAHDLTLVTHNTPDFAEVPGLRIIDWLAT